MSRDGSTRARLRAMSDAGLEDLISRDRSGDGYPTPARLIAAARRERARRQPLEVRESRRRPWRVHVHEIGPNFSYGTARAAHLKAAELTGHAPSTSPDRYSTVTVWHSAGAGEDVWPMRRTVYRHDRLEVVEIFSPATGYRWIPEPDLERQILLEEIASDPNLDAGGRVRRAH